MNNPQTVPHKVDTIRMKLEAAIEDVRLLGEWGSPLVGPLLSLLAAVDYDDQPLIKAHLQTVFEELGRVMIQTIAAIPTHAEELCRKMLRLLDGYVGSGAEIREAGRELDKMFDQQLSAISDFRRIVEYLQVRGFCTDSRKAINESINTINKLREKVVSACLVSPESAHLDWNAIRRSEQSDDHELLSDLIKREHGS